jgi:hypothetical protein
MRFEILISKMKINKHASGLSAFINSSGGIRRSATAFSPHLPASKSRGILTQADKKYITHNPFPE